ncbi:serine/threonine-protein phosphatase-like protein 2A activator 1 [Calycina marina]|uniref:Serine/threonine-protein phosphatase 2A activator n=1 Tax=Calycina marina TaxID=1763456 RepID=A0A9P7Z8B5_9HELO|nr:serine/threonine-protein phosphatase-like protein 2A activator 1 [Calycina marina]
MEPPTLNTRIVEDRLPILEASTPHAFIVPTKKIHEGHDVPQFLTSKAYRDIGIFIMQLNIAMCPQKISGSGKVQAWQLGSSITLSKPMLQLQDLMQRINAIIEEAPPDTGPRRFGNVSFRRWHEILESRVHDLLRTYLPSSVLGFGATDQVSPMEELTPYLLGAFGSAQRLDYGTGHELSFLAFLGCIWKLGGFAAEGSKDRSLERSLVVGVIEPYLQVVRRLILTYTLEPAGSHGVWGLDDHSFLPYIFGSSQYCPPTALGDPMPTEGALTNSPNPGDISKKSLVDKERKHNMYFSAVGFINDVKTGPFWEHSPILFDISGVRSGWGKINKGMIKMYNAEVLSKFPVVQHFPFGSLFSFEQDPNAAPATSSIHTAFHPSSAHVNRPQESTKAPWASAPSLPSGDMNGSSMAPTAAPWAAKSRPTPSGMPLTAAPWASPSRPAHSGMPSTVAPRATNSERTVRDRSKDRDGRGR